MINRLSLQIHFFIQIINLSFQVKSNVISSVGFCWPALNERQSWCSLNQRQRWFLNFSQHAVPHTFSNDFLWKMKMRPMSDTMGISSDTWCMEFGWLLSISLRALWLRVFVTWGRMSSQPHRASEAAWSQLMAFTQHSPACQQDLDTEHRKISLFHTHCSQVSWSRAVQCIHPMQPSCIYPKQQSLLSVLCFYFSTCSPTVWAELRLRALSTSSYWSARADFCFTSGQCSRQGCKVSEQYQSCNRWVFSFLWICQITDKSFGL